MKKLLSILLLLPILVYSQYRVPEKIKNTYVCDYTGSLTQNQVNDLNGRIRSLKASTTVEIGICIVPTLQGVDIEDAATKTFRTWGIGQAGRNNGILYLLCPNERKGKIEVGTGLEGDVTDLQTGELQRDQRQYYKNGDYYTGISNVLNGLIDMVPRPRQAAPQNFQGTPVTQQRPNSDSGQGGVMFLFILGCLIVAGFVVWVFYQKARKRKEEENKRKADEEAILAEEHRKEQAILNEERKIEKEKKDKEKAVSDLKYELDKLPLSVTALISNLDSSLSLLQNSIVADAYPKHKSLRDRVINDANKVFNDSTSWVPDSMDTVTVLKKLQLLVNEKGKLNALSGSILSDINTAIQEEQYVKDSIPRLTRLRKQALVELPNTPLDLPRDATFTLIANCMSNFRQHFDSSKRFEEQYNKIINYRKEKKAEEDRIEQQRLQRIRDEEERQRREIRRREQEEEDRQRRRRQDEEDEDRRRRDSYSSNSSWSSSSDSSSSWGSSSSDDSSSFSGGSSSGGGSSDSW